MTIIERQISQMIDFSELQSLNVYSAIPFLKKCNAAICRNQNDKAYKVNDEFKFSNHKKFELINYWDVRVDFLLYGFVLLSPSGKVLYFMPANRILARGDQLVWDVCKMHLVFQDKVYFVKNYWNVSQKDTWLKDGF